MEIIIRRDKEARTLMADIIAPNLSVALTRAVSYAGLEFIEDKVVPFCVTRVEAFYTGTTEFSNLV